MSTHADEEDEDRSVDQPRAPVGYRLQYLLKLAHLRIAELIGPALQPYGVDGRELAVLASLSGQDPLSQRQVARRLGIDRTTMVALIDGLEDKGLVERRTHPDDRRRNVVKLTTPGADTLRDATRAADEAERRFLEPLADTDSERLREALRVLISAQDERR